jgi:pimeloyl-ACP methyl ester carboxylesterase
MSREIPLVLIPGHLGTALSWRYQADELGRDREIIIPEDHTGLASIKSMAACIALRLPAAFDLAAWSMGGYIAFELLPLVPERVRRTMLIHTSARPDTLEASTARRTLLERLRMEDPEAVFSRQLVEGIWDLSRVEASFLRSIVAENLRLGFASIEAQVTALITRGDSRPVLPKLKGKFLVVAGRHDAITTPEAAQEIATLLPDARLHVFEDVGHFSPWEKPRELNALMRAFLA